MIAARLFATTLLVASTSLATAHAFQQSGQPPNAYPFASGDLGSMIVGEFTGDGRVDAVVLHNGKPVLRETIETFQTFIKADVTGVDIARLPGTGSGGRDQVAMIGAGGLYVLEFTDAGTWSSDNVRNSGTPWANATAIAVGQVDVNAHYDICAVTSTHKAICVLSNGAGGWIGDSEIPLAFSPTDLVLFDWDGASNGVDEVALLHPAIGAKVFRAGSPPVTFAWNAGPIRGVAFSEPGLAYERLALVRTTTSSQVQDVVVHDIAHSESALSLGALGVVGLAAGDWSGDGYDDLVLAVNTSATTKVLTNDGSSSGATFDYANRSFSIATGQGNRPYEEHDGAPALIDVDFDDDLDLVSALQGDYIGGSWSYNDPRFNQVLVVRNGLVDHVALQVGVKYQAGVEASPNPLFHTDSGVFSLSFTLPTTVLGGAELEVKAWSTSSEHAETDPVPCGSASLVLTPPLNLEFTFQGKAGFCLFSERFTLVARQVVRDQNGQILDQGTATIITIVGATNIGLIDGAPEFTIHCTDQGEPDDGGGASGTPPMPPTPPGTRP